jgi:diguanylate cyclase
MTPAHDSGRRGPTQTAHSRFNIPEGPVIPGAADNLDVNQRDPPLPMPPYATVAERRARDLQFVRRVHRMRMLGTVLCALPIASVLAERGVGWPLWAVMVFNAVGWPLLANCLCRRARDPARAQFRCLTLDAAASGAWSAAIAVSLAPTVLFVTMATADKIAAGGWRLVKRSSLALLAGFVLAWGLLGWPFEPRASDRTLLLCIPFLFVYTVALSVVTNRLGQRIRVQNRELERRNRTDPAMQVANRPYFEQVAAEALARFQRTGRPAALVLLDVDHFKQVNDRHGHAMGDAVLQRIAALLRDSVRESDLPGRYGGDEFALLLVDATLPQALEVAERIRRETAALRFDGASSLSCTLSLGVAAASPQDPTLDAWMRSADAALYRAKAAGRNRVVAHAPAPPGDPAPQSNSTSTG